MSLQNPENLKYSNVLKMKEISKSNCKNCSDAPPSTLQWQFKRNKYRTFLPKYYGDQKFQISSLEWIISTWAPMLSTQIGALHLKPWFEGVKEAFKISWNSELMSVKQRRSRTCKKPLKNLKNTGFSFFHFIPLSVKPVFENRFKFR